MLPLPSLLDRAVRCDACGARNTDEAAWCGQCFAPLDDDVVDEPVSDDEALDADPAAAAPGVGTGGSLAGPDAARAATPAAVAAGAARPGGGQREVVHGDVRATAAGPEWACRTCREWNPIDEPACTVCGTPLALEATTAEPVPEVRPELLVAASVMAPGAGHVLLGRTGEGAARLLLAASWSLGGLTLLRGALGSGRPVLPAVPLLLGWAVLVLGCTNDALVHAGVPGRELLGSRALLWLTVAVIGLTAAGALVGVLQVTGG